MRKSAIIFLSIGLFLLCSIEVRAASFTSVTSGSWHDVNTWGGAGLPSVNDSATISAGHNVTINLGSIGICNQLTVQNTATLSGAGRFESRISGVTASVVNNGLISVATISMPTESGTYNLSGTGNWTPNQLAIDFASVAQLAGNITVAPTTMNVATSATLNLNGFNLNFNGNDFTNNGTLNVGNGVFNFNGTDNFNNTGGTITGTGSLRFAPGDGTANIGSNTAISPSIQVASGTLSGCFHGSTISGSLTIDAGAVLNCNSGIMTLNNNLTVNGALTRTAGNNGVNLNFNGTTLTNNGTISLGFLVFNNSGAALAQSIAGTGSWTPGVSISIGEGPNLSPSTTSLANNVTIAFDQFLIQQSSTLNLNGNTMTFGGNTFSTFGTLAVGSGTFNFNGNNLFSTTFPGQITGTGIVKLSPGDGSANISGRTQTKLEFVSGVMTQTSSLNVGGDFTINAGATLTINNLVTNTFANVVNNGTLSGNPAATFVVAGTNFTNNGTISNVTVFFLPGACCPPFAPSSPSVAQTLSGTGNWSGNGTLSIAANSQTTLQSDVNFGAATLTVDGLLDSGLNTLTLPATVVSNGSGDVTGNLKRTGFVNGAALSFGNLHNTIRFDSGTPPNDVTLNLSLTPPPGFSTAVQRSYTITPNGGIGYTATLRLHYADSELNGNNETGLQLWRRNGANWLPQGAVARDTSANWVETNNVTQFSPWAIAQLAPTAANVSIAGRVFTSTGRGVSKAYLTITDSNGNIRYALTNPFGFYRFNNIPTGETYVVAARHKQHSFIPKVISVSEDLSELNFTDEP